MAEHHRKRKRNLTVFFTDEERELLDAKADDAEMSKAGYIRNIILFGAAHKKTVFSDEYGEEIRCRLNGIGNNINQIAQKANATSIFDNGDMDLFYENFIELLSVYDEFIRGKSTDCDR